MSSPFKSATLNTLALLALALAVAGDVQARKIEPNSLPMTTAASKTLAAPATLPAKKVADVDGAIGGELATTRWKVTIPAGAFSGTASVTVSEVAGAEPTVELTLSDPTKNAFRVPVTLSLKYADAIEASDKTIYLWDTDKLTWVEVAGRASDKDGWVKVQLMHFSTYKGGKAGW